MHEYSGAIHIHSTYSDGTGSIPDIAGYAGEVGLDFIMLTDHNTLKPKHDGFEGWYGDTMVLIGYEINDREDKNHYLAFGLDRTVGDQLPPEEYVRRVRERGGIGFIAHPDEKRNHMAQHPPFPWNRWELDSYDGIEIWNHMSEWMEGLTEENKFQRFIHPLRSITGPAARTLKRWDSLNQQRFVAAIGGVDAHAYKSNLLGFFDVEIFPYKVMFKSIRTHVLLDEPLHRGSPQHFEMEKRMIYDALRTGRSFIANAYHGAARGFRFYGVAGSTLITSGDGIPLSGGLRFVAEIPQHARLRLMQNGKVLHENMGTRLEWKVRERGVYRLEAWIGNKAWIFSNPIRVGLDA